MIPVTPAKTLRAAEKKGIPIALFSGLAAMFGIATTWFVLETYQLIREEPPITWYVRNKASNHPWSTSIIAAVAGVSLGAAVTHFIADENL